MTPFRIPARQGSYDWNQFYTFPERGSGTIRFAALGTNDVHVAISPRQANSDPMYEIVIGGWGNTQSVIRRSSQGPAVATVKAGLREPGGSNTLEVSIDQKTGKIQVVGLLAAVSYVDPAFIADAQFVSFSTWDTPIDYSILYCGPFLHGPGEGTRCDPSLLRRVHQQLASRALSGLYGHAPGYTR